MEKKYLDTYCRGLWYFAGHNKSVNELSNENINRYICKITGTKYIGDSFDAMKNAVETYLEQNTTVFAGNPKHIMRAGEGTSSYAMKEIVEKVQNSTTVLRQDASADDVFGTLFG